MLKIYDIWIKTMILVVLCFIGYELHNLPKKDYTEKLSNIEKVLNDIRYAKNEYIIMLDSMNNYADTLEKEIKEYEYIERLKKDLDRSRTR